MNAILALDQGTTSSRAIVFNHDGSIRAAAQQEFRQIFPQAGWVEHDPEEIYATTLAMAREALDSAGITGKRCLTPIAKCERLATARNASTPPISTALAMDTRRRSASSIAPAPSSSSVLGGFLIASMTGK